MYRKIIATVLLLLLLASIKTYALTNGLALTPPMGYNSWYANGADISETMIKSVADEMVTNGMLAAGYQYINLDDGWAGYRDTNGVMVANTNKFPGGMKALADYLHAKGFKMGLYTVAGPITCAQLPGSQDHIEQDANTYATWGIDYLKFEGCSLPLYEILPRQQIYILRMKQALEYSGRPILFSSSSANNIENWMPDAINVWRGTGDVNSFWPTILNHIDFVSQTPNLAGPGKWNDPDVLEVGNSHFNPDETKSIFTMWCELSAPLLTITSGRGQTEILCNQDAIAVDQDPACIQGICLNPTSQWQVWNKPLGSSNSAVRAVALFNRVNPKSTITAKWEDIGIPNGTATVWDIWAHAYRGTSTNFYSGIVAPHGVQFLRITADSNLPQPAPGTNYLGDMPWLADSTGAITFSNHAPFIRDYSTALAPITLHGTQYTKGFGTIAPSRTSFWLGGCSGHFKSDMGLDDAAQNLGSIIFSVYLDGVKVFQTGAMSTSSPIQSIDLDVSGHMVLTLEATNAVNGNVNDYADWAGARLEVTPTLPTTPTELIATPTTTNISLHWNLAFGANSYVLRRSTSSGGPYTFLGVSTNASFTDTNSSPGVSYFYTVSAQNTLGQTPESNEAGSSLQSLWISADSSSPQSWSVNSNWANTPFYPNAIGNSVVISSAIQSNQIISLNSNISAGSLTLGATDGIASFEIASTGLGNLTFDNGLSPATLTQSASSKGDELATLMSIPSNLTVNNRSTSPLTLSGNISGTGGITSIGIGTVLLTASNSFYGPVLITNGVLQLHDSAALGATNTITTILPAGTLDIYGNDVGSRAIIAAGPGNSNSGAILNSSTNTATNALQNLTLSGDMTLGGNTRWDIRGPVPFVAGGTVSTGGSAFSINKTGANQVTLADVAVDPALGDVLVSNGILALENSTTSLGNPTNSVIISSGATLSFNNTSAIWNKEFHLFSDGSTPSILITSGSNTLAGKIYLDSTNIISVASGILNISSGFSGTGTVIKNFPGTLVLSANPAFTGLLDVQAGKAALANTLNANSISSIHLAASGVLDTSNLPVDFTLTNGQSLSGGGTILGNVVVGPQAILSCTNGNESLTFQSNLTLTSNSTCILGINPASGTNNQICITGNLSLNGFLNLIPDAGDSITTSNTFKLFSASNIQGGFSAINPRTPAIGLLWDTSTLTTDGVLRVVPGNLPFFSKLALSNDTLRISGLNGTPNAFYYVLFSTNPSIPSAQWTRIATNHYDSIGGFSITNLIPGNSSGGFYQVQTP